jgi:phosphatidylserine/phosphatidylglycerophosphate/cardiolipin synthase-like enzyme
MCVADCAVVWEAIKSMSMVGRLSGALALLLLVSCSGTLPGTALRRHEANQHYKVNDSTPLVALMRERHIEPPDEDSATPLLEQLQAEMAKSDRSGRFNGVTYELTYGNRLASDWVVQTPDNWGRKASDLKFYPLDCKDCDPDILLPSCSSDADCGGGTCGAIWPAPGSTVRRQACFGHSDALLPRIYDLVASARLSVDINLLQPAPDTRFLGALRAAFGALARSGRPVSIRILVGQYPPNNVDAGDFLAKVSGEIKDVPNAHIRISVAAMRSCTSFDDCDSFSWNHSKIIAVDGREALVGGHNLYSQDYLIGDPVHDLSMRISGPAAASASRFSDTLWQYVCSNLNQAKAISLASLATDQSLPEGSCPPSPSTKAVPVKGGVPIMAVGRLASGVTPDFANHSDLARDLMLGAAKHSIKIVQQDLGFNYGRADTLFPESNLERLVAFLMRGEGDVYLVLSNDGSYGPDGGTYSNGVPLTTLAHHLREMVQERFYTKDPASRYAIRTGPDPVNALLCDHVHLAPFRFGPDDKWPDHQTFATHAKLWMIDDRAFYIGSDNMYPVNLQEYGYIVDDKKAAGELLDSYWNPLWQSSQRAAVSGPGVENCIFREIIK